jgi:YVTN family beta-propeller protein
MENHGKIQRLIVVITLNITGLALVVGVLNFTYAQELHQKTLYEITKYTPKENAYINVGRHPSAIGVNPDTDKIYVANNGDNTVSVIDGDNNTKIGKDIPVGKFPLAPTDVAVNSETDRIYVANQATGGIYGGKGNGTVSVIDGDNDTKIGKDIPVGNSGAITVNSNTNTIYVVNSEDNTISVINGTNSTKIKDIPVGKVPKDIGVNSNTNTIYVVNSEDNTISVINGTNSPQIKVIPVGNFPSAIGVDEITNEVYVANMFDGNVSVINGTTNKVIGKPIPVGKIPSSIGVNTHTNTIYVANPEDNTVSTLVADQESYCVNGHLICQTCPI